MASKFLVPLHLANFATTPASPANGFVKVYVKNQFLTYLAPDGVANASVITSSDNLLQAVNKLQASFRTFELTGDVTGTGVYTSNKFVVQTNVVAVSADVTDYDYDILGNRDSSNKVFSLRYAFLSNSTKVFLNGIRLTPGVEYDYIEVQPNKIEFSTAPFDKDFITVDYKATL
jgi:hypothetical protein